MTDRFFPGAMLHIRHTG